MSMKCFHSLMFGLGVLPYFLSLVLVTAETQQQRIVDLRPGFLDPTTQNNTADDDENTMIVPQPRIIGGTNARQDRYPYFVSLVDTFGRHTCGASLVAPDTILTAAHCQGATRRAHVGRWNRQDDSNDDYEDISLAFPEIPHPSYNDEGFANDFMIIKLNGVSSKPYVQVNEDPAVPRGNTENEVTVIGFGNTISGVTSLANILQEVDLTYIPNPICELSKDSRQSYQNQIIDSMLCAGDTGEDSCQGDSGGPLIVGSSGTAEQDVLIGVISWGFGCALPQFPGVYSRVSAEYEWLRATICTVSDVAPDYLNCANSATAPTSSVPVTVGIQFDDFPEETSWSITSSSDGTVYAAVPAGTYSEPRSRVQETVFLPAGGTVVFQMEDSFGDGLCCNSPGNYIVSLGSRPNGEILVSGGGRFDGAQLHEFIVPEDYSEEDNDDVPTIGQGQIPLTLVLQLDEKPHEIGWKVERLGIEVETVIEIPAGIYKIPGATVVRTIVLEENELYYFRVYDVTSDGIDNGSVQLFLGTADVNDESKKVLDEDGDFKGGLDFSFLATTDPQPTEPPMVEGGAYLTLQLYFDLYPGEVGIQLRAANSETVLERQNSRDNSVVFFRPPRYYSNFVNERVTERIPIPTPSVGARREFTLIVTDSFSDGLCCNWNRTEQTGYTLYNGDPAFGEILVDSSFIGTAREVTSFAVESSPDEGRDEVSGGVAEADPKDFVEIKVTITLDLFPDETGFYIEDSSGFRIADFPSGSFTESEQVVVEYFTVPAGVYTFTVTDTFGDGINRDGGFYRVEIISDDDRPAVLSGSGLFVTQKSYRFVLEGKSADYPMTIKFTTDSKPEEFSFSVKRLDLLDADAVVASIPRSTYLDEDFSISETIMVQKGALYRIIFEDAGKDGIGGDILIIMGSDNENDFDATSYVVDARELSAKQIKLYAGQLPTPDMDAVSLDLRVTFDQFPQEMEWILVGGTDRFSSSLPSSFSKQKVIAYGPVEPYSESLAGTEHIETIYLPAYAGEKTFSIIFTDAAGDGVCCTFGSGGPVEVFKGSAGDGTLLFSEPFRGVGRVVQSFVIVGSGESSASRQSVFLAVLASLFLSSFSCFV